MKDRKKMRHSPQKHRLFPGIAAALVGALALSGLAAFVSQMQETLADPLPYKEAYLNAAPSPDNGLQSAPVPVEPGDEITYKITLDNVKAPLPRYDVLFVLDWSGSMRDGLMNSSGQAARLYAKDLMMDMSQFIFDYYPDSRVALLGMNTGVGQYSGIYNCSNNLSYSYIQLQTDFLSKTQYQTALPSIQAGFDVPIPFAYDDNAQFLAAGINKLRGLSTVYGSSLGSGYTRSLIPRADQSRTPVIVHISDFQMTENISSIAGRHYLYNTTNPQERYWSVTMKRQVNAFASAFPDGILLTVRTDHDKQAQDHNVYATGVAPPFMDGYYGTGFSLTGGFSNVLYDGYMASHYTPSFTRVPYGTPYTGALNTTKNDFRNRVPPPPGSVVTDKVPPGLTVDAGSISHGGIYDPGTHTITWDLTGEPPGEITVSFKAKVAGLGTFDNTAHLLYPGGTDEHTNHTYHKCSPKPVAGRKDAQVQPGGTGPWNPIDNGDPMPVTFGRGDRIKHTITASNPNAIPITVGASIKDILPPGLEIVSYSPGTPTPIITYDAVTDQYTIEWPFDSFPAGNTTCEIVCEVKSGTLVSEDFVNFALIETEFQTPYETNKTYHRLPKYQIAEKFHADIDDPPGSGNYPEIWPDGTPHTLYRGESWIPATDHGAIPGRRWIAGYPYDLIPNVYKQEVDTAAHTPWTTGYGNIQNDHTVIYPYQKGVYMEFPVTETFRKYTDPDQRVNAVTNPDITTHVPGGGDFDPAAGIPPPDIGSYTYVGYRIDGGTIVCGKPPAPPPHLLEYVTGSHEITYLYAELASKTAQVIHGGTGVPEPEDTGTLEAPVLARPGDDILYSIKLTIPEELAQSGSVTVTDELPQGLSTDNTRASHGGTVNFDSATERYTVIWVIHFPTAPAPSGTLDLTVRTSVTERATFINQANAVLNEQSYIEPYTTNYTVHDHLKPGARALHIRQIILARDPLKTYTELPPVGFFQADNDGKITSLLSASGLRGTIVPYTVYTLPPSGNPEYRIDNLVPQYYEWKDYELTSDPSIPHDRTHLSVGRPAQLDYQNEREYWLTVYLTPRQLIGKYSWDFRTNTVGMFYELLL